MKKILLLLIFFSCGYTSKLSAQSEIDSTLLKEIERMFVVDQFAASKSRSSSNLSTTEWADSVYHAHQKFLENTLNRLGFPGYDKLGKRGSTLYWAMVQHSDFDINFQKQVLDSMFQEVQNNNADPVDYAYLLDRVKMNTGEKLVYGTQVTYHWFTGKARIRPTIDPEKLNSRRAEIGLEPIEIYLEEMSEVNNLQGNSIISGITNLGVLSIITLIVISALVVFFLFKRKGATDNNS